MQQKQQHSKSLWNYALSPGWTKQEVEILKIALMKFGVGRWKNIEKSECLPTKTIAQMYLQAQRLVGQQSLAEFMGLHIDLEQIWLKNQAKEGPGVLRKYGCIINTGDTLNAAQVKKLREKNKREFGLSSKFVSDLHLPKAKVREWLKVLTIDQIMNERSNFSSAEKVHHLSILIVALERKKKKLLRLQELTNLYKPCNLGVVVQKVMADGIFTNV